MKHYLVTGGAGFIGSHLARALLERGDRVRVLDDLSSGSRKKIPAGVDFLRGNICDPAILKRAFRGVDGCFHLAAIASVTRSVEDWSGTHRVNLGGTVNVFDAARRHDAVPVVYASSAAVYGDHDRLPLKEDLTPRPLSPYAADKAACELHAAAASRAYGLASSGLRFFNVYGPGQDPASPYSGVISIFAERARRWQGIVIFGDGGQSRDFIYVADVVQALLRAMTRVQRAPAVLNICTGRSITLLQLVRTLQDITGRPLPVTFAKARPGDIYASCGSPVRARKALSAFASTPLKQGLMHLLDSL